MGEDGRVEDGVTRAELRARRARLRRTADPARAADGYADDDDAGQDDVDVTRIVVRRALDADAADVEAADEHTSIAQRRSAPPAPQPVQSVSLDADDDDLDRTRLIFQPRHDDDPPAGGEPEGDLLDHTALAVRHRVADDATLRSPRAQPAAADETWARGAEQRRDTLTGEQTQSASASVRGIIEAPRRRVVADGDGERSARVASVPAVIDVMDVYRPRVAEDPLAAHLALEPSTRGPAAVIDGAGVLVEQRRRGRRRLAGLVATIVVVWVAAAAGVVTLLLL